MSVVLRGLVARLITWLLFQAATVAVIMYFMEGQFSGNYWIAFAIMFGVLFLVDLFLAFRRVVGVAIHHFLTVETRTLALMREFRTKGFPKDVAGQEWDTYAANALAETDLPGEVRDAINALGGAVQGMRVISISSAVMLQSTLDRAILRYLAQ